MDAQQELPTGDDLVQFLTHEEFVEFADELVREHTGLPDSAAFFEAMQAGRLDFTDPLICEVAVEIEPVRPRR